MDPDNRKFLYKVAKAYYDDNLTQQQIGEHFGLSRVKISRMLRQARSEKIVQITISASETSDAGLEREMEERFGLKEAVIVSCSDSSAAAVTSEIGPVAAGYLSRILHGNEILAVSWGHSLLSVINSLPSANFPDLRVVQLTGGLGEMEGRTHGAELARRMAQALGARLRLLQAPGIVKNREVRDALVNDPQISDTLRLATQAQVALVGIGLCKASSTLLGGNHLFPEEIQDLTRKGAVGDIALRFFDENGRKVKSLIDERIVGSSFEDIRTIARVIGVAGGKEKFPVIKAALQGELIDVLITDKQTGQRLVK